MTNKLIALGVTFEEHKVVTLNSYLEKRVGFDVVVNCMGLGCAQAVGDEDVFPARGQVTRIYPYNHIVATVLIVKCCNNTKWMRLCVVVDSAP
jgi:hypothetical protein